MSYHISISITIALIVVALIIHEIGLRNLVLGFWSNKKLFIFHAGGVIFVGNTMFKGGSYELKNNCGPRKQKFFQKTKVKVVKSLMTLIDLGQNLDIIL